MNQHQSYYLLGTSCKKVCHSLIRQSTLAIRIYIASAAAWKNSLFSLQPVYKNNIQQSVTKSESSLSICGSLLGTSIWNNGSSRWPTDCLSAIYLINNILQTFTSNGLFDLKSPLDWNTVTDCRICEIPNCSNRIDFIFLLFNNKLLGYWW
jgi:hypothetical protein